MRSESCPAETKSISYLQPDLSSICQALHLCMFFSNIKESKSKLCSPSLQIYIDGTAEVVSVPQRVPQASPCPAFHWFWVRYSKLHCLASCLAHCLGSWSNHLFFQTIRRSVGGWHNKTQVLLVPCPAVNLQAAEFQKEPRAWVQEDG